MKNYRLDRDTNAGVSDRSRNHRKGGMAAALRPRRWASILVTLLSFFVICGRSFGNEETLKVVRIGYQKYGSFNVVKARHTFDDQLAKRGIKIHWILFPAGPQLLEAMNAGAIDLGHTGEAPPIFAQAANNPFVYIGNQHPDPSGEAILVAANSPIRSVTDLKEKKVALNKGSNVHYLLVRALENAGLKYSDIHPVYLTPADARAAFDSGSVDAWVIWDPFLTVARVATKARVLVDGTGLVANREFFLADRKFVEAHPEIIADLTKAVDEASVWAKDQPRAVAELLSHEVGIDVDTLQQITEHLPWGFQPVTPSVIADQQKIADAFFTLNLIPKKLDVREATLPAFLSSKEER
jgi:sulfonate transport system substrate-binding protein